MWISLHFSYLGFTEIHGHDYLHLSSNLRHFDHYFFKYYFHFFSLSSLSGSLIIHMLGCLMVFNRSLGFCSFFFIPLSFWSSHWVISMDLCSSSLFFSSPCSNQPLSPSSEFSIPVVFCNARMSIWSFL